MLAIYRKEKLALLQKYIEKPGKWNNLIIVYLVYIYISFIALFYATNMSLHVDYRLSCMCWNIQTNWAYTLITNLL